MATYHAKKDLWEARRTVQGKRKSFYATSESEAERRADEYKAVPRSHSLNPTLKQYAFESYIPTVINHSPKWREQIAWALDLHILPMLGHTPLSNLERNLIQSLLSSKLRSLSRTSVGHLRKVLFAICDLAEADGLIPNNPVRKVKLPPARTKEEVILTVEQVAQAWKNAQSPELQNAIFLGMLGLRKGEVLGVRLADARSDGVMVEHQYDGQPLKNQSAQRTVPMPPNWYLHLARTAEGGPAGLLNERSLNGYYTYTNKAGKKIPARGFKAALAKAGLPDVTFHSLRKTCATTLLELGCPAELRDAILGHSGSHVRDRYNRANVEQMRGFMTQLIKRFEKALEEVKVC